MTFTIYLLTSPSGKHYVGQTSQPIEARWKHGTGYKSCVALNKAIQKYGWDNFTHEILAVCDTGEEADELEKKFIQEYNCIVPNGYNIDRGGNANKIMGEETKRKIGDANRGRVHSEDVRKRMSDGGKGRVPWNKGKTGVYTDETRAAMAAGMKGRQSPRNGVKLSDETKEKLSAAHKGKPWSEERRKAQERRKQCDLLKSGENNMFL